MKENFKRGSMQIPSFFSEGRIFLGWGVGSYPLSPHPPSPHMILNNLINFSKSILREWTLWYCIIIILMHILGQKWPWQGWIYCMLFMHAAGSRYLWSKNQKVHKNTIILNIEFWLFLFFCLQVLWLSSESDNCGALHFPIFPIFPIPLFPIFRKK